MKRSKKRRKPVLNYQKTLPGFRGSSAQRLPSTQKKGSYSDLHRKIFIQVIFWRNMNPKCPILRMIESWMPDPRASRRQYLIIWWIPPKPLGNRHSWIDNLLAQKTTLACYQVEKRSGKQRKPLLDFQKTLVGLIDKLSGRANSNLGLLSSGKKRSKKQRKPLLDYQKTLPNWIKWIEIHA